MAANELVEGRAITASGEAHQGTLVVDQSVRHDAVTIGLGRLTHERSDPVARQSVRLSDQ
ncbi:MAG: hypothetical protein WKF48_00330 [Solirubrobacteraceae bacterium]